MTRDEMAQVVELEATDPTSAAESELRAVAAELRKTCATCQHFGDRSLPVFDDNDPQLTGWCFYVSVQVPFDGSGFCHRWEPKP